MRTFYLLATFLFLLAGNLSGRAQDLTGDLALVLNTSSEQVQAQKVSILVSEQKLLFLGALRFYQTFISSQDMAVCNFIPSCSHFSQEAFRKAGVFRGLLLSSDRLQRCNGTAAFSHIYHYDVGSRKFSDPVERYLELK